MTTLLTAVDRYNHAQSKFVESTAIDSILFPVELQDLYLPNGIQSGYKSLIKTDTNEELTVGKEYEPIYNKDLVAAIEPLLDMGFKYSKIRNYDNKKFFVSLKNMGMQLDINGESACFSVNIQNSYDKSLKFQMQAGGFILVCSNGLTIGKGCSIAMKHTKQVKDFQLALQDKVSPLYQGMLKMVENKDWTATDMDKVQKVFQAICAPFPERKNSPTVVETAIAAQFAIDIKTYPEQPEFALYMAATNVATHGYATGVPASYILKLEEIIPTVFFKN